MVREARTSHNFGDKKYLTFDYLTHIPIQKKLIDFSLMSGAEVRWLNEYHAVVWEKVSPRVTDEKVKAWLKEACAPVTGQDGGRRRLTRVYHRGGVFKCES